MNHLAQRVSVPVRNWYENGLAWLLLGKRALYGLSATRIMVGVAALGILLTNFRTRHVVWGPGSFWVAPFREGSHFESWTALFATTSPAWFTVLYLLVIALAVAVTLGWRTRPMALLLAVGLASLVERAPLLGNQGDNIVRIGLLLLVLMNASEYWSLDAGRRRRAGGLPLARANFLARLRWSEPVLPEWLTTLIHNAALITLALQVFILYTASALYKVQGSLWQNGTALYYPLSLHEYAVFPSLNTLLTSNPVLLTLATYFAVYVQLFFAIGLLHPVSRRLALIGIIVLHVGIALLMALPWFSLSMIAFDAIFVSSATYAALHGYLARKFSPLIRHVRTRLELSRRR